MVRPVIGKIVPDTVKSRFRHFRLRAEIERHASENRERTAESVFSEIYANNLWGGREGEFNSGAGSAGEAARLYLDGINAFIRSRDVSSVVDIGCGDYSVGQRISCDRYTGIDVVPAVISHHAAAFGNGHRSFVCMDAAGPESLPSGDLCLVRQVLQHLSNAQILAILEKLKQYRYAIVTEHQPAVRDFVSFNRDKVHGRHTRLYGGSGVYLDHPPFDATVDLLFEHRGDPAAVEVHDRGSIRSFLITRFPTSLPPDRGPT